MATTQLNKPHIPSEAEAILSQESSRILASYLQHSSPTQKLRILEENGNEQILEIPKNWLRVLNSVEGKY